MGEIAIGLMEYRERVALHRGKLAGQLRIERADAVGGLLEQFGDVDVLEVHAEVGQGLAQLRGDLHVHVEVLTPTKLDARQEELLRELATLRDEEQPTGTVQTGNASSGGLFSRLRDAFNTH